MKIKNKMERNNINLKNFSIEINGNRIDFRVTDTQFTCLSNDDEFLLDYITEAIGKGKIPNVRSVDDITIKRLNYIQIEKDASQGDNGNENSLEEMLITLVAQNPPLYDCTLPLKSRTLNIRNDIWSSLVELLQEAGFSVNVEAVKNKWKYLRDHFLKLRAIVDKHVPTGSAASCIDKRDAEKAKAWEYFSSMQFLKDSTEKRATTSSLNITATADNEKTVEEIDRATSSSKRRKKEDDAFLNKLQEITNISIPEIPKMDEVDNFCQHLVAGSRRLPIQSRYKVEIEYLRILGDAHVLNVDRTKNDSGDPSDRSPNIADQVNDFLDDPECSSVGAQLIASKLCLCTQKTNLFQMYEENDIVFCSAVDSIGEKLIGCNREVNLEKTPLLRPSQRVPYQSLCNLHKNRLIRHNCCPTCGVFCTQGRFVECDAKHQYHRHCQISIGNIECCPHCGLSTPAQDVFIKMHCARKPVFFPVQESYCPSAKMTFQNNEDIGICSFPLLLPLETSQVFDTARMNGRNFTENDAINAVKEEDISIMASIIASNTVNIHFRLSDFNDGTLLHYAAHKGSLKVCHLLVSSGLEIDDFDKEQNTPLMLAINSKKNDVVQYLIRTGASITNKGTDGITPLHVAAKCGNLTACDILLMAAATIKDYVNCQDDGGWTPLVWACENGFDEVADFLITKNADALLRDVEHNEALHWAAFSGNSHIVELLLNRGGDVNTVNAHGETPLWKSPCQISGETVGMTSNLVRKKFREGTGNWHISAREDKYNSVIVLLARGANLFLANKNNETPLECVPEDGICYNVIAFNAQIQSITGTNRTKYKTILSNDISKGREKNPIQCVNNVDDEPQPKKFVYTTRCRITSDGFSIDDKLSLLKTCNCGERCTSDECECGKLSMKCWYDEDGKLLPDFKFSDTPVIFECNDACSCNAITCKNRVVQKGLQQRFQLYKTDSKGWGVKTLKFIPKGSYVCEYIGEILADVEADRREDDTFFFDLDNKGVESFCVDAKYFGNFARFINHSCTPNLHPVKVFTDHQDLRFPKISFFACKDITVGEELCFDYGRKFWLVKYKSFTCECESPECRYSRESIKETLMMLDEDNDDEVP